MLSYLNSEINFVRAFGNRVLIITLLCALTRTAERQGGTSVLGFSISLNPAIIAVYGPLLILLLLVGLRAESRVLLLAREVVLEEAVKLPAKSRRIDRAIYLLFWAPIAGEIFLILQYYQNVVPVTSDGCNFYRLRQFYDWSLHSGKASIYCINDIRGGMPWIYVPIQIYLYILILLLCVFLTWEIVKNWPRARG